jgi:hypothetical protein
VFLSYACTRISSLVENESLVGSSLGTLAVARYILELYILVKHLIGGRLYGLVCARLLYQDRLNHERALFDQHLCEIEVYEKFQLVESSKIERGSIGTAEDMAKLDQEARQSFCFYLEKAKYSGYGYWADRMKREMLPSIQSQIELLERKLGEFDAGGTVDRGLTAHGRPNVASGAFLGSRATAQLFSVYFNKPIAPPFASRRVSCYFRLSTGSPDNTARTAPASA